MGWQDQGRQEHGWFGNGTADHNGALNDWHAAVASFTASQGKPDQTSLSKFVSTEQTGGDPVPVKLNDGTEIIDPLTKRPLVQPSGVSLPENISIGESLRFLVPTDRLGAGSLARNLRMIYLFFPTMSMDYQRVYGTNGLINKDFVHFGNFNFGAVAAAAGYSLDNALLGAAVVNQFGAGRKDGIYWNNPDNVVMIELGFNLYHEGKLFYQNTK